jgi:heat shock protein HslJ
VRTRGCAGGMAVQSYIDVRLLSITIPASISSVSRRPSDVAKFADRVRLTCSETGHIDTMAEALGLRRLRQPLVPVISGTCAALLSICPLAMLSAQPVTIENTRWALTAVVGVVRDARQVSAGLLLDSSEGRAYGSAGCNDFSARYRITARQIAFQRVSATRKRCPDPEAMKVEDAYLAALRRVQTWRLQGTTLSLRGAEGKPLLTFERSRTERGPQLD